MPGPQRRFAHKTANSQTCTSGAGFVHDGALRHLVAATTSQGRRDAPHPDTAARTLALAWARDRRAFARHCGAGAPAWGPERVAIDAGYAWFAKRDRHERHDRGATLWSAGPCWGNHGDSASH